MARHSVHLSAPSRSAACFFEPKSLFPGVDCRVWTLEKAAAALICASGSEQPTLPSANQGQTHLVAARVQLEFRASQGHYDATWANLLALLFTFSGLRPTSWRLSQKGHNSVSPASPCCRSFSASLFLSAGLISPLDWLVGFLRATPSVYCQVS